MTYGYPRFSDVRWVPALIAAWMSLLVAFTLVAPTHAAERPAAEGRDVTRDAAADVTRIDLDRRNIRTGTSDAPEARQGDVRRTVVKHTRRNVIVHLRFAQLDREGYAVRLFVGLRTGSGHTYTLVQQARHLESFDRDPLELQRGNGAKWRCDDARTRWRWGQDTVSVRVPRSCLGGPRMVKAAPTMTTRYATPEGFYILGDDSYDEGYKRRPQYGPGVRSR